MHTFLGNPQGKRDHFEDLDVEGRIILKLILEENGVNLQLRLKGSG
jgi:hypothetical protein